MADIYKLRVCVAREDEDHNYPIIYAAMAETMWEIIGPSEWDAYKQSHADEQLGPDWGGYDLTEAVLYIPEDLLTRLFSPPIPVAGVEPAPVEGKEAEQR